MRRAWLIPWVALGTLGVDAPARTAAPLPYADLPFGSALADRLATEDLFAFVRADGLPAWSTGTAWVERSESHVAVNVAVSRTQVPPTPGAPALAGALAEVATLLDRPCEDTARMLGRPATWDPERGEPGWRFHGTPAAPVADRIGLQCHDGRVIRVSVARMALLSWVVGTHPWQQVVAAARARPPAPLGAPWFLGVAPGQSIATLVDRWGPPSDAGCVVDCLFVWRSLVEVVTTADGAVQRLAIDAVDRGPYGYVREALLGLAPRDAAWTAEVTALEAILDGAIPRAWGRPSPPVTPPTVEPEPGLRWTLRGRAPSRIAITWLDPAYQRAIELVAEVTRDDGARRPPPVDPPVPLLDRVPGCELIACRGGDEGRLFLQVADVAKLRAAGHTGAALDGLDAPYPAWVARHGTPGFCHDVEVAGAPALSCSWGDLSVTFEGPLLFATRVELSRDGLAPARPARRGSP